MPFPRVLLAAAACAALGTVALVAQSNKPAGAAMADAAGKFLTGLDAPQKAKAAFKFADPTREDWAFTPQQDKNKQPLRKGVRFDELTAAQKDAALALLKTGLSTRGFEQASTIMSLEGILAELEGPKGSMTRDPNWYFVSVFGDPSNTGRWGWRIEGHHLSVNLTLDKGEVVSATPMLFAANPAEVKQGAKKGLKPLPDTEDRAKELIAALDAEQAKVARQAKQFPEIREKNPTAGVGDPVGLPGAKLTKEQAAMLWKLVETYAGRMTPEAAAAELKRATAAGADKIHFAYCVEDAKPGKPYTYRVQGPTFVIEFLNVQADSARNPANHIHSGWRRLPADFGK